MKSLLPLNETSVIANRIGQTKGTAEPCNIPGVARQGSFGRRTPKGTVGNRLALNKHCFPYLMVCYFCSFNHKGLLLVSYDPLFVSKYFKITFNPSLVHGQNLEYSFLTT